MKNTVVRRNTKASNSTPVVQETVERPKAGLWMNIGKIAKNGEFISLPYGLPLDTMPHDKNNPARNKLLDKLLEACEKIPEGEDRQLKVELVIRFRKVGNVVAVEDDLFDDEEFDFE